VLIISITVIDQRDAAQFSDDFVCSDSCPGILLVEFHADGLGYEGVTEKTITDLGCCVGAVPGTYGCLRGVMVQGKLHDKSLLTSIERAAKHSQS